jgi:hypothetical protein
MLGREIDDSSGVYNAIDEMIKKIPPKSLNQLRTEL